MGRTYIGLLLAAGCDRAYVMARVAHTDPTLTPRIYQQVLKRWRLGPAPGPNSLLVPGGCCALG